MKTCVQCSHYIGGGDWDLCCHAGEHRLCYEDTPADDCPSFKQTTLCKNHSSYVGMCEDEVGETCPNCGSTIAGAMWSGQKHWKGE